MENILVDGKELTKEQFEEFKKTFKGKLIENGVNVYVTKQKLNG